MTDKEFNEMVDKCVSVKNQINKLLEDSGLSLHHDTWLVDEEIGYTGFHLNDRKDS